MFVSIVLFVLVVVMFGVGLGMMVVYVGVVLWGFVFGGVLMLF